MVVLAIEGSVMLGWWCKRSLIVSKLERLGTALDVETTFGGLRAANSETGK